MPPNSPRVISEDGHIDTTGAIAGVYQEDEPMRLKCEVVGGRSSLNFEVANATSGPVQYTYITMDHAMVTTTQMIFVLLTSENVSRSPLARGDVVDRRTDGGRLVLLGVGRHSHQQAHRHEGHQVRIGHDFRLYLWVISPAQS